MNQNAKQLLNLLCREYDKLSKCHHQRPFPEFSATIQSQHGFCYVRCPMGSQRFSIVNIRLSPSIRGQGVLTAFLEYIESHPHHYQGVEVALIENKSLAKRLLNLGWQYRSFFTRFFSSDKPTLVHDF